MILVRWGRPSLGQLVKVSARTPGLQRRDGVSRLQQRIQQYMVRCTSIGSLIGPVLSGSPGSQVMVATVHTRAMAQPDRKDYAVITHAVSIIRFNSCQGEMDPCKAGEQHTIGCQGTSRRANVAQSSMCP